MSDAPNIKLKRCKGADAMETIKIFNPANLRPLLCEMLKTSNHDKIAKLGGVAYGTVQRWDKVPDIDYQGGLQDNLYRIFGAALFTHGLNIEKFRARLEEECKKHGGQRLAAIQFGVGRTTFNSWRQRHSTPLMSAHQHIYDKYGISVFKRMKDNAK